MADALRKANKIYQMEILGKGGESTHPGLTGAHAEYRCPGEPGRTAVRGLA